MNEPDGSYSIGDVSIDDLDAIEEKLGMTSRGWDFLDPKEIIAACWNRQREIRQNTKDHPDCLPLPALPGGVD